MTVIKTTALTKSYGKARGIIDVNLKIEKGEFFGFIGPNGAGKSTTIRTLLGLIYPSSGEAEVLGQDISQVRNVLNDIGYMPSEATFYDQMKVKEILEFSAKLTGSNCVDERKRLTDIFQLDVNKKIRELSLGNRKKVAIVCALQHKPSLYILDEPTSGLDPLMQKAFFNVLKERNEEGATIFFSSHVLSEVQRNCSRAAIIREGEIVAVDSMDKLAKTNTKRVVLHGVSQVPKGISARAVSATLDSISFIYQGDIKELISRINEMPITDVTVMEPDLEDIFMHYYEKEAQ